MCFGIRILSSFHLATQIVSIQNLNYPKNAKKNAFIKWSLSCTDSAYWRSIKQLHNECFMVYSIWARDTNEYHSEWEQKRTFFNEKTRFKEIWKKNWFYTANMEDHFTFMEEHYKNHDLAAFFAFLGQWGFWMDIIWVARWNGLKILIPKHMWKSKIRLLEQK